LPSRTTHFEGVVRSVPTIEPNTSAITHAESAVASVQPRPTIKYWIQVPEPSAAGWR
jgi:hypothetical protein